GSAILLWTPQALMVTDHAGQPRVHIPRVPFPEVVGLGRRSPPAVALGPGGRVLVLGSEVRSDPLQETPPLQEGAAVLSLGERPWRAPLAPDARVRAVAASPCGTEVALGTDDGQVLQVSLTTSP